MRINISKAVARGATVGYVAADRMVFQAEYHWTNNEGGERVHTLIDSEGRCVYVVDDDIEEIEYGEG